MCTVLGSMGMDLPRMIFMLCHQANQSDVDENQCILISKHVTEGLLCYHKDLVKVVAAVSLDPKRASCQATIDTRDEMFCKINSCWIVSWCLSVSVDNFSCNKKLWSNNRIILFCLVRSILNFQLLETCYNSWVSSVAIFVTIWRLIHTMWSTIG